MAAGAPDLGALLAGLGAGGGQGGGMPQGPPPGPPQAQPDQPDPQGAGDPLDLLRQIVDMCHQYIQVEPDDVDKAEGAKLLMAAQKLLAKDQQDRDQAMGGGNMRLIRKAG